MSYVISVVGAGGKTSYIERLAERLASVGLRVCVTTTTHIYAQSDRENISFIGADSGEGKLSYPGDEAFAEVCRNFDVVMVEADGSRHMPVKIPASYEPVVPKCSDQIVVVMGHNAVGRAIGEACQRFDSADRSALDERFPGLNDSTILDAEIIDFIAQKYYVEKLSAEFPSPQVRYVRNNLFVNVGLQRGKKIALVIMASGMSRRFLHHTNKLLYKIRGKEIVRYGLDNLVDARRMLADFGVGAEIFAVTADEELSELLRRVYGEGVSVLSNPESSEGIAASVRHGAMAALNGKFDALLLLAGDMPNFGSGDIARLVLEFLCSGKTYGCAYSSRPSNPGMFLPESYSRLLQLSGDTGAMRLIKSAQAYTHFYVVSPEKLLDVDTLQDIGSIITSTLPPQIMPSSLGSESSS